MASSSETSETTTVPAVDARDVCDVAIVGAGPGGLAAALALQRRGYDVRVFERREAFRPAGVAVFIWPHGLEHLKRIDAATCARVVAAGASIDTIAVERLDPGATEPEELLTINVAGWSERMDLPPQIVAYATQACLLLSFAGITFGVMSTNLEEGGEQEMLGLGNVQKSLDNMRGVEDARIAETKMDIELDEALADGVILSQSAKDKRDRQ